MAPKKRTASGDANPSSSKRAHFERQPAEFRPPRSRAPDKSRSPERSAIRKPETISDPRERRRRQPAESDFVQYTSASEDYYDDATGDSSAYESGADARTPTVTQTRKSVATTRTPATALTPTLQQMSFKGEGKTARGRTPSVKETTLLIINSDTQSNELPLYNKVFRKNAPEQASQDDVLARSVSHLVGAIVKFAETFFDVTLPKEGHKRGDFLSELLIPENKQLIRYLGCLAIAGENGRNHWKDLLSKGPERQALVIGVLGRALKEHVFGELFFGGEPNEVEAIWQQEKNFESYEDGFARTKWRANFVSGKVNKRLPKKRDEALEEACEELAARLDTMLEPFLQEPQASKENPKPQALPPAEQRRKSLYEIVKYAAVLGRLMHQVPDVVYYWPPTFKDEEFEPRRMECLNLRAMIQESPYTKSTEDGYSRAKLIKKEYANQSEAIVKIVCFPGLMAYRQGASLEIDEKEIKQREASGRIGDKVTRESGFRARVICKSVVFLKWGRQRLLTREAGTSAHIDAVREGPAGMEKYEKDNKGYKELYHIWQEENGMAV